MVLTYNLFHSFNVFLNEVGFQNKQTDWQLPLQMVFPFMVGLLFLSFHMWYKKTKNTWYIFPQLFLFHCFRQVATNFTFTSETSVLLLLLKCLPSNSKIKLFVKKVEHNWKKPFLTVYEEMFNWDTLFYSVFQFLKYSTDFPIFISLVFSNDYWNMIVFFVENNQVVLKH